jgi:hypothetical protein
MQTVKVLPLDRWMSSTRAFPYFNLTETNPFFNRDGIYLSVKKCWFEVNGKAYLYDKKQFVYDLQLMNDLEVCQRKVKLFGELIKENIASKDQKRIFYAHKYFSFGIKSRLSLFKRLKKLYEN